MPTIDSFISEMIVSPDRKLVDTVNQCIMLMSTRIPCDTIPSLYILHYTYR